MSQPKEGFVVSFTSIDSITFLAISEGFLSSPPMMGIKNSTSGSLYFFLVIAKTKIIKRGREDLPLFSPAIAHYLAFAASRIFTFLMQSKSRSADPAAVVENLR